MWKSSNKCLKLNHNAMSICFLGKDPFTWNDFLFYPKKHLRHNPHWVASGPWQAFWVKSKTWAWLSIIHCQKYSSIVEMLRFELLEKGVWAILIRSSNVVEVITNFRGKDKRWWWQQIMPWSRLSFCWETSSTWVERLNADRPVGWRSQQLSRLKRVIEEADN